MKKLFFLFYFLFFTTPLYALNLDQNFLNQFDGIAIKTLSKSETLNSKSSQHELHGVKEIANILVRNRKVFDTFYIKK